MKKTIINRVIKEGRYLSDNNSTIREVATIFNNSKSNVHKDLKERLPLIDNNLFEKVDETLRSNFLNRHLRGGEKTRQKYQKLK